MVHSLTHSAKQVLAAHTCTLVANYTPHMCPTSGLLLLLLLQVRKILQLLPESAVATVLRLILQVLGWWWDQIGERAEVSALVLRMSLRYSYYIGSIYIPYRLFWLQFVCGQMWERHDHIFLINRVIQSILGICLQWILLDLLRRLLLQNIYGQLLHWERLSNAIQTSIEVVQWLNKMLQYPVVWTRLIG